MKKVYCIGELLIDLVSDNGEIYQKKPGGAPANVAVTVSKLGGASYFLGQVGHDTFGTFLENVLIQHQVKTRYMTKEGKTTLALVSIDESGERDFEFYRGSDEAYQVKVSTLNMDECTIVHFGSATVFLGGELMNTTYEVLAEAVAKKAMISFDPNYRDVLISEEQLESYIQHCWNFMKNSDFIKLSDEEAMLLTKTSTFEEAVTYLKVSNLKTIAITLGKKGTLLIEGQDSIIIPSITINQKDSTGAGDAFVGGVLYELSLNQKKSYKQIIEFANIVGAMTCEEYGAIPAIPSMEKVISKMNNL